MSLPDSNDAPVSIETDGGTVINGDVNTTRDFTGRDKNTTNITNINLGSTEWITSLKSLCLNVAKLLQQYWLGLPLWLILTGLFCYYKDRYLISYSTYILDTFILFGNVWHWQKIRYSSKSQRIIRTRLVSALFPITLSSLFFFQVRAILYPMPVDIEKFGIAVATFGDGPSYRLSDRSREISSLLQQDIRNEMAENARLTNMIELRQVGVITNNDEADEELQRINAKLILWGYISEQGDEYIVYHQVSEIPGFADASSYPRVLPIHQPNTRTTIRFIDDPGRLDLTDKSSKQNQGLATFWLGLYYYLAENNPKQAVNYFQSALDYFEPIDFDENRINLGFVYYYLGKSRQLLGDYTDSQMALEKAENILGKDPAITLGKAYNYRAVEDKTNLDVAIKEVLQLTQVHSDNIAAMYDRALAYELAEDFESALLVYRDILHCNPTFTSCKSDMFIAYLSAARMLMRKQEFEYAENLYEQATKLAEGDNERKYWLLIDLGNLHGARSNDEQALKSYNEAVALHPTYVTPYYYRAKLRERSGDWDAAVMDYKRAIELSHNPVFVYLDLAALLRKLGLYDQAIDSYQNALRFDSSQTALIHAFIGEIHTKRNDEPNALNEFALALNNPSPFESYIRASYGVSLAHFERVDQAIEQFKLVLQQTPNDVNTALNLAQLYESTSQSLKAKELYKILLGHQISPSQRKEIKEKLERLDLESNFSKNNL